MAVSSCEPAIGSQVVVAATGGISTRKKHTYGNLYSGWAALSSVIYAGSSRRECRPIDSHEKRIGMGKRERARAICIISSHGSVPNGQNTHVRVLFLKGNEKAVGPILNIGVLSVIATVSSCRHNNTGFTVSFQSIMISSFYDVLVATAWGIKNY